jgi:hypothetical protein
LRNAQRKEGGKVRVDHLKLVEVVVATSVLAMDMTPVLAAVVAQVVAQVVAGVDKVAQLAMTGSLIRLTLKAVLFLQKFVRAVSHVAEMNRMSVGAVLEKRATHLVRRDIENIVCLRRGATDFLKLATVGQNVVLLDVRGVVVETTILGIGNTDAVVKLVISSMFFLAGLPTRLAMKMAQSSIYLNQIVDFLLQIRVARIQST